MKKNILLYTMVVGFITICMLSCKRDFTLISPVSVTDGMASLRIIDAAPNFRKIFGMPDSFNVFVNGTKITAFTPSSAFLMTYNSGFPTATSGYGYVAVPPGISSIKLSVAGTVNPDSIPIITFTKNLAANQLYTFMITDSINSTKDSSQIFVQDIYQQPVVGFFNLRFIHAVLNDTAGKTIDVWSTRTNRNIFAAVKPGSISGFAQYPYNGSYSDTFFVRRSGTLQTLDTLLSVNFSNQRSYTLYYKGNAGSNSNADIKRRHLATYVHQ